MEVRLNALRKKFRSLGIANFIVTKLEQFKQSNIRYLCGYTGSNGVLLVTKRDAFFITDGRYIAQAHEEVKNAEVFIYSTGSSATDAFVTEMKNNKSIRFRGKIGIEGQGMTAEFYQALRDTFPKSELVYTYFLVEGIAAVKDKSEIESIRKAVEITDKTFQKVLTKLKPGVAERELSAEITYYHALFGAEKDAFESIVASGPRSALPHGIASTRVIESGDLVTFDIGCFVDGYASDMTRTVVVGRASDEQRKVYNIVLDAQQRALESIKPGVKCADIDKVARKTISDAGYGDNFTHGLGHGLGHFVHTRPVLSMLSKDRLEPGNVVTVEPGIYIEGFGGVRIEDDVLVTEDGYEILNRSPKELIEI